MLVHHTDTARDRFGRRAKVYRRTVHAHHSRVGTNQAEGDARHGSLAGPIFPEKRVHRSLTQAQRRSREGLDGAETLVDVEELEREGHDPVGTTRKAQGR